MIFSPVAFWQQKDDGLDPDAQTFLTAASITDATIINSVDTLVKGLKINNLWDRMYAIYPFVGGTSTTHKFNLKDARDLNEAYRLSFSGGVTHDNNGVTGNGSNGFADTFLPHSAALFNVDGLFVSMHLSVYIRTNTTGGRQEIGINRTTGSGTEESGIVPRFSDNRFYAIIGYNFPFVASSDSRGFWIANRPTNDRTEGWKNGTRVINSTNTIGATSVINDSFNILCRKNAFQNNRDRFSDRNVSLITIGKSLSESQSESLSDLVSTFQTTLGRNV
jgi:hypothetical protein